MNLPVPAEAWEDARDILDAHCGEHGDFAFAGLENRGRQSSPSL